MSHPQSNTPSAVPQKIDVQYELTQGFAAAFIRRTARNLSRQTGFSLSDQDDLQQEMSIRVLERLSKFDPAKGCFNAFVKLIVTQFASSASRHARAKKRDRSSDISLSVLVQGDGGLVELAQLVGPNEINSRLAREERPKEQLLELADDIAALLKTLPPRLRRIAKRMPDHSVTQIAKDLKLHRSTVHMEIRKLRKIFADAGLHEYLPTHRQ